MTAGTNRMQIGFIGIGRMGNPMAGRLLDAGHRLAIHDIDPAACRQLAARGAAVRSSPADVARDSPMILTSVPGPDEVEVVMSGPDGVLAGAARGSLIVELSTISPAQSRALANRCAELGLAYIDAPVSNGVGPAARGELTIMVGGDAAALERARPVLNVLGNRIYHLGPVGSGNVAKIANQIVYLSYVAAFTEVARMGRHCGLDVPALIDLLRNSVGGAPMMTGWEKRLETGDLEPGFMVRRVLKDLGLGHQICVEDGFSAPILEEVIATFRRAYDAGYSEKDMTAIYRQPN
jgi:3-hydroxyisobutyrate dehydrogenase-like beta-hydroxyacid dehydrogenase